MKKNVFKFSLLIGVIFLTCIYCFKISNKENIDKILKTNAYSYLPKEAKNYIKSVYEDTGLIILTQKNKENGKPYLNPEYVNYISASEEDQESFGSIPLSMVTDYVELTNNESNDLPISYDLRNVDGKNFVTPVRDQGGLGICWAFASVGSAETYILKKNDTTYSDDSLLISERQIDYATSTNGIKDYNNNYVNFLKRELGSGGNFALASILMASGVSLYNYNDFKSFDYTDLNQMEVAEVINYNKSLYELNSTISMPILELRKSTDNLTTDEVSTYDSYISSIKNYILTYGGAYTSTYMDPSCYYYDTNSKMNVLDVYQCSYNSGHALQIIGWDDNYEYSYCYDNNEHTVLTSECQNKVEGTGAWILKNSWGIYDQYVYMTYDSKVMDLNFYKDLISKTEKNWDNNYTVSNGPYDVAYSSKLTYKLSSSDIVDTEILKKIKFIGLEENATYTVKINGVSEEKEFTVTADMPGLLTINTDGIEIDKNSTFVITGTKMFVDKVVLLTKNKNTSAYIDFSNIEGKTYNYGDYRFYSITKNISSGESITYKIYDKSENEVTNLFTISNNIVAGNDINTSITINENVDASEYKIVAMYDSIVIGSAKFYVSKMSGSGTETDPYVITSGEELSQIRNNLSAYYVLGNDIDLTVDTRNGGDLSLKSANCPDDFGWESISGFSGSLDGKGHTIKGLYQRGHVYCESGDNFSNNYSNTGNGLFESTSGNVTIKNLVLEDFDIECYGGACGILVSNYNANNYDPNKYNTDTNAYTANFENIVAINNNVKSTYIASGTGLFGYLLSTYGTININNIYMNHNITPADSDLSTRAMIAYKINSVYVNLKNIRLSGNVNEVDSEDAQSSILVHDMQSSQTINMDSIVSTVKGNNIKSNLINNIYARNVNTNNIIVYSNVNNNNLYNKENYYGESKQTNINIFTNISDFINYDYSSFDMNKYWVQETIDGVKRIPTLKISNMEYTKVNDIIINQKLNENYNIYDYVTPSNKLSNMISYKSNDSSIININENGDLIPASSGKTTINIQSLYDGYIKDVPVTVNYLPHYTLVFDSNEGNGAMDSMVIQTNNQVSLPDNLFTKENYEFNGWNTKKDGSGIDYKNNDTISFDNESGQVILYAQWIGKEITVTFNANGGNCSTSNKVVRYGQTYGSLPIPYKENSAFISWKCEDNDVYYDSVYSCDTLKASWQDDSYNVIYHANTGNLINNLDNLTNPNVVIKIYDNTNLNVDLEGNIFAKENYILKNWNTQPDGNGTSYNLSSAIKFDTINNSQINLYATWEEIKDIENNTKDKEIIYDGQEYSLDINVNITDYDIKYSLDNINFNLDNLPMFKDIGEYTIYYKITKTGYRQLTGSNKVKIYGIKSINESIVVKNDILVITNQSFNNLKNNINISSNFNFIEHLNSNMNVSNVDNIKTGDLIKININGIKDYYYKLSFLGDVNGDGLISIIDYIRIMKDIMGTQKLSGVYYESADMNKNGTIDIIDYIKIMKIIMEDK